MCRLNVMDVEAIQECLISYKKLIGWFPATEKIDEDLRDARLNIVDYLINKCDDVLEKEHEQGNN